ncbi:hypothetical protein IJG22_01630 [Candidatus Saccharibacteria bacterium]|nr:hypothetical protein [Candidatus Saccharibacteria bacterium]
MRCKMRSRMVVLTGYIVLMVAVVLSVGYMNVYADGGGSGTGGGGGADSSKDCDSAQYTNLNPCGGSNSDVGGASWHIFKTYDKIWEKYGLYQNGPRYCAFSYENANCARPMGLNGTKYDGGLAAQCPKDTYEYYYAFVYDGWDGVGIKNKVTFWGPLAYDTLINGTTPVPRNNYGMLNLSQLEAKLSSGYSVHREKVSEDIVKLACKVANSGDCSGYSNIVKPLPTGLGYVCAIKNFTLKAFAKDMNGKNLNGTDPIDTDTASVLIGGTGGRATVSSSKFNPSGYRFKGWSDTAGAKSSGGLSVTTRTYSIDNLTSDKKVYAYYEKISDPPETVTVTLRAYAKNVSGAEMHKNKTTGVWEPISTNSIKIEKSKKGWAEAQRIRYEDGNSSSDANGDGRNDALANYEFVCWSTSPETSNNLPKSCISCSDSRMTSNCRRFNVEIGQDTNVYAFYKYKQPDPGPTIDNYTLTADAYDVETNTLIEANMDSSSVTVERGKSGTPEPPLQRKTYENYDFVGWSKAKPSTGSYLSTGDSYTEAISSNTKVYAYYKKKKYGCIRLNYEALGINSPSLISLSSGSVDSTLLISNGSASGTLSTPSAPNYEKSGWRFKGWKTTKTLVDYNNSNTYITGSTYSTTLTVVEDQNGCTTANVYGYYEKILEPVTLTAYAVDEETNEIIDDVNNKPMDQQSTNIWKLGGQKGSLTVTKKDYTGYVPVPCWRDARDKTKNCESTGNSYTKSIGTNTTVYLYYKRVYKNVALTAYARNSVSGNDINNNQAIDSKTGSVWVLGSGSLTVNYQDIVGYTPVPCWRLRSNLSDSCASTGNSYTQNINGSDIANSTANPVQYYAYAYYDRNTFQGQSSVTSGSTTTSSGYSVSPSAQYAYIQNCSPTSGCSVTFTHNLKRTLGSGTTTYYIERTSTLTTTSRGITNATLQTATTWGANKQNNTPEQVKSDGPLTLYPGMRVCEMLYFKPYNTANASYAHTEICAVALGKAQGDDPDDPDTPEDPEPNNQPDVNTSNDTAFINIKVRNTNVSKYNKYQRAVYAKPGDLLRYRAVYNPNLQYTYYLRPDLMKVNSSTKYTNPSAKLLGGLFNEKAPSLSMQNWNNAFGIQLYRNSSTSGDVMNYTGHPVGNFSRYAPAPNGVTVLATDVGKNVNERATTSLNDDTQTTPSQVVFTKDGNTNNVLSTVSTAQKSKTANAYIPYNFIIGGGITTPESTGGTPTVFNAGESTSVDINITVNEKPNSETTNGSNEKYATSVENAQYELIVYNPGAIAGGQKGSGIVNGDRSADICSLYFGRNDSASCDHATKRTVGKLSPGETQFNGEGFVVQDQPAGSKVCVALAVFPATSGADVNWNNKNYDSRWYVSDSKCYVVGKKPNMQVVGGNIFSSGKITAGLTTKKHLYGYNNYAAGGATGDPYLFGSWGELGVISSGIVNVFGSGASLGYARNTDGALWPNPLRNDIADRRMTPPGGKQTKKLCELSPLTISKCTNGSSGQAGGASGKNAMGGVNSDKKSLESFVNGFKSGENAVEVSGSLTISGDATNYYHSNSTLTISGVSGLGSGVVKVVDADDDITVNANIAYADGDYANLRSVPKLVIHSAKNIKINCGVDRVDAVLVANVVNTCADSNDINSVRNSRQLTINGAVVANKLEAKRTYGAAQGTNSMVSAEIINFDPSLYIWGGDNAGDSNDGSNAAGDLDVTYVHELAPRY